MDGWLLSRRMSNSIRVASEIVIDVDIATIAVTDALLILQHCFYVISLSTCLFLPFYRCY